MGHKTRIFLLILIVQSMISLLSIGIDSPVVSSTYAASYYDIFTHDDQEVLVTNDIDDPLREGANNPGAGVNGLYRNGQITTFLQAQNDTIAFIQRLVNRALSIVGLVALVYLLYNGFLMITANGDDAQFKKGEKAVKTALIALVGIAFSALFVNFILYIIARII